MQITKDSIIGEVVANDYRTASVFKQNGIDFCCKGNRTIEEACTAKGGEYQDLIDALIQTASAQFSEAHNYSDWELDFLANYIENQHHKYVRRRTEEIKPFLDKVAKVHGHANPELIEIQQLFLESAGELASHMAKEEFILFPFIKKLVQAKKNGATMTMPQFGTVDNPINMMKHEHEAEGDRFRKIAQLSDNYTPPAHACNTYRVAFAMLEEFERDLHLHIHLENNILFPGAISLEQEICLEQV